MKNYFVKCLVVPADWRGSSTKYVKRFFLCSRDIQVGDKFLFPDKEGVTKENISEVGNSMFDPRYWILGNNGILYDRVKCLKVIGAISPDALEYVKEGDEFDEEQIEYQTHIYEDGFDNDKETYFNPIYKDWRHTIGIKGPCGHFH